MLRIRLSRHGAKKDPHFRVVVADKSSPRDGRFVEVVGYYNPALKPARLKLDLDRVDYWVEKGARPSDTVQSLIQRVRNAAAEAVSGAGPAKDAEGSESEEAESEREEPEKEEEQSG